MASKLDLHFNRGFARVRPGAAGASSNLARSQLQSLHSTVSEWCSTPLPLTVHILMRSVRYASLPVLVVELPRLVGGSGEAGKAFKNRDAHPRTVLETRCGVCARDPRKPSRGRARRLHHRTNARLSTGREGRSAKSKKDRQRAALSAGHQSKPAPRPTRP